MSLRLDIKRVFAQRTVKVHCVDLHVTEPWVLWSLDSGHISILNYQALLQKKDPIITLKVCTLPVSSAKFIPETEWIAAVDDICISVLHCKTGDKIRTFVAHDDKINCIAVHPNLPYVLSSSRDNLIKVWNRNERWRCIQTFKAHLDDVVHVCFNPNDCKSFASASHDNTTKMWNLNCPDPIYSFDHQENVNCVGYSSHGSHLITGSETSKVWDYEKKNCIEDLGDQKQGVITFVGFHPELPIIITGSQDGRLRIWNVKTHRLEKTLNYCLGGVCTVGYKKGTRMVAIGFEGGIMMIEINRGLAIPSMDDKGNIVWAKDKIQTVNINTNFEMVEGKMISLVGKELGNCDIYPQSLKFRSDGKYVGICGDGCYMIYTVPLWKSKVLGDALEFVWSTGNEYSIMESTSVVKIFNKSFKEIKTIRPTFSVERIFGGVLLSVCSNKSICFYDWSNGRMIQQFEMKARDVYWSGGGDMVAIASNASLFFFKFNRESEKEESFEPPLELNELVRSGNWVGDNFVYINSAWRFNFYSGGEVCAMYCPMYHLERPMHMLRYLSSQSCLYLFDKEMKLVGYPVVKSLAEYKKLVMHGNWKAADGVLKSIPETHHNSVAHFLESRGLLQEAYNITTDVEHRFRLAAQLGILEIEKVAELHKYIGPNEIDIRIRTVCTSSVIFLEEKRDNEYYNGVACYRRRHKNVIMQAYLCKLLQLDAINLIVCFCCLSMFHVMINVCNSFFYDTIS